MENYYCATDDGDPLETEAEACGKALVNYLADKGAVSANNTSCAADGAHHGGDACPGWSGNRSKYALLLTDVPIGHGGVNVKDFAHVRGPGFASLYEAGVPDMVAPYITTGEYEKTSDLTATNQESGEFTLATHGGGINPLLVTAVISCTAGCEPPDGLAACRTGGDYSADGWACVQQISPDPEDP